MEEQVASLPTSNKQLQQLLEPAVKSRRLDVTTGISDKLNLITKEWGNSNRRLGEGTRVL